MRPESISDRPEEQILPGGNSNRVVRIGNTVRRRPVENASAVHRLLDHLSAVGFVESPEFLGIDRQGSEILQYIEGTVGNYPLPPETAAEPALRESARLLRRFHEASKQLVNEKLIWPRQPTGGHESEVVCHHDFAPYNLVFRNSMPVGVIDFDNAGLGRRVDDLAYFIYRFAPLAASANLSDAGWPLTVDRFARVRIAIDEYGLETDSHLVSDLVLEWLHGQIDWISARASVHDPIVAAHIEGDHIGIYKRDVEFIEGNYSRLQHVLSR